MPGRQEHSIVDEERKIDHTSEDYGPGDVTATVIDYDPEWETTSGDPCEWALVRLRFMPLAGTSASDAIDQYVALVLMRRLRRLDGATYPEWVFEAWSYDTRPSGDAIHGPNGELYQAINVRLSSAEADLTMGKLLDRLIGKAHYYF